ncbi:MAG TPA: hypothetical protein VGC67_11200 [Cellulomonas sp.]
MRDQVLAESRLQARRRVTPVAAAVAFLLVLLMAAFRLASSSGDATSAVLKAQRLAEELTTLTGETVSPSSTYDEPRYVFASASAYDLAGVTIAVTLVLLVAGAVLTGGDWRTRTNRMTFATASSRGGPAVIRVLVWGGIGTLVTASALVLTTVLLLGVATTRGSVVGIDIITVLLILLRGVLLGSLGAVLGAALGSMVRSDVLIVVAVLAYVLGLELLAPVLLASSGWISPGAHLITLVISDGEPLRVDAPCAVPLCADPVSSGWGPASAYAFAAVGALALLLGTWRTARLPVWS